MMNGTAVMGIDPGLMGGIAIVHPKDGVLLEPMPVTDGDINIKELQRFVGDHASELFVAYVEEPPIMPKNGAIAHFKLGRAFGIVMGVLVTHGVPVVLVRPQEWMKAMHQPNKSLDSKERSQLAFSRMFPHVDARRSVRCRKNDEGMVEATLIAEYGRRQGGVL